MNYLNAILVLAVTTGTFYIFNIIENSFANEESKLGLTTSNAVPSPDSYNPESQQKPANDYPQFIYPNATSTNSDRTSFRSSDDSNTITNWYKKKIKDLGMNTTSFIQTNTNGYILNKLVGSDGKKEINVEISEKNGQEVLIILNVTE